jgi:glycosyltransferase involved in cell wall biosynthesis
MKVVFISNRLTFHQLPFCLKMREKLNNDFSFVATESIDPMRVSMYPDIKILSGNLIKSYESDADLIHIEELIRTSDVVIIGSTSDDIIVNRLKQHKLTFKYSERLYKQGLSLKGLPRAIVSAWLHHGRFQKYPLYMLCASAYTAVDVATFGNYNGRTYRWGYFPVVKQYDIEQLLKNKREGVVTVLWAGRFIDWKHPEHALLVAQRLDKENVDFQLKMIGNGEEFDRIKSLAANMELKNPIEFLGTMSPDEVRKHMEEANIYLFTSDFNEGWGAVLNESMNSGCAVVASHAIGSVPFLIKHGESGLIYNNGDVNDLCNNVLSIVKDISLCETLGRNAYLTIKDTWNAEVAADRFIKLSESLLHGDVYEVNEGPCSKADVINNNWFNSSNSKNHGEY